jgi:2-(1,2-epoxy-1,2-dihydrophenyl)acetyl-CoA isomerase
VAYIHTEFQAGVQTLRLNRPEKVNAFNHDMVMALRKAFKEALAPEIRCVVLTGVQGVFSAGNDVSEMREAQGTDISYRKHLQETYNPLILQIRQLPKPVLAAINGPVAGAGLGVALACDLRIAADTARFSVGFTGLGLVPDSGVSLLLPALIGLGRATEYTFSNARISAEEALAWGMVNRVVPAESLEETTAQIAAMLAAGPTHAYALTKRAFNRSVFPNLEDALDYEAHLQEIAQRSKEHREGVAAFLEKRPPKFI